MARKTIQRNAWTGDIPTEHGWYWLRLPTKRVIRDRYPQAVQVIANEMYSGSKVWVQFKGKWFPIEDKMFKCALWHGPIYPPVC